MCMCVFVFCLLVTYYKIVFTFYSMYELNWAHTHCNCAGGFFTLNSYIKYTWINVCIHSAYSNFLPSSYSMVLCVSNLNILNIYLVTGAIHIFGWLMKMLGIVLRMCVRFVCAQCMNKLQTKFLFFFELFSIIWLFLSLFEHG